MTTDKFTALVLALRDVGSDIGLYPAALKGMNDERDYAQRDGYKNGFNAGVMEYGGAVEKVIEQATAGLSEDLVMLLASDILSMGQDGKLLVNFNDTWGWALAWHETVEPQEVPEVARLFRAWGWAGLLYWATVNGRNPGLKSEFKDNNRFIEFVAREEAFKLAEPNDSKRAYMDLPEAQ